MGGPKFVMAEGGLEIRHGGKTQGLLQWRRDMKFVTMEGNFETHHLKIRHGRKTRDSL